MIVREARCACGALKARVEGDPVRRSNATVSIPQAPDWQASGAGSPGARSHAGA